MWHSAEFVFAGPFLCYCSRTTKVYLKNPKVSERPGALYYMFKCSFLTELLFPLEFFVPFPFEVCFLFLFISP